MVYFSLLIAFSLYFAHCTDAWQYTDKKDKDKVKGKDVFGVKDFDLDLKSRNTLKFHLKAEPYIDIIAGEGDRIPRLSIKIFEVDSKKKIYKGKKSLCDHVQQSCPLLHNKVVDINLKSRQHSDILSL